jgi:ATP-dependent DNA helicase RecQ
LESYKDNIALNYISGILRLITEQFDDSDGEQRMAASLSRISNFSANEIEAIITKTASLAPLLSDDAKSKLTEILYKHIPDDALLEKLNESFQDEYSYKTLLGKIEKKLSKIVTKLKEVDWWLESKN